VKRHVKVRVQINTSLSEEETLVLIGSSLYALGLDWQLLEVQTEELNENHRSPKEAEGGMKSAILRFIRKPCFTPFQSNRVRSTRQGRVLGKRTEILLGFRPQPNLISPNRVNNGMSAHGVKAARKALFSFLPYKTRLGRVDAKLIMKE
jgi:hypothetical protein